MSIMIVIFFGGIELYWGGLPCTIAPAYGRECDNLLEQVMPRAKARALPASKGFSAGPARLNPPNRPPQPTNPIFDPEGCKAYIRVVPCRLSL